MAFDPYSQWLGVRSKGRPPDCFDLLRVAADEMDPVRLLQAAETRVAMVRPHLDGPRGDEAKRLVNELADAVDCLTDPVRRAEHEMDLLRQGRRVPDELADRPASSSVAIGRPTCDDSLCGRTLTGSTVKEETGSTAEETFHPHASQDLGPRTPNRIAQVGLVSAVALVLAGGIIGFCWVVAGGRPVEVGVTTPRSANHQQPAPGINLPDSSLQADRKTNEPSRSMANPSQGRSRNSGPVFPESKGRQAVVVGVGPRSGERSYDGRSLDDPQPPNAPQPIERGDPFRDLPTVVELPSLGSSEPVCWGVVYAGSLSDWKLTLLWNESGLKRNRQFVTESAEVPNGETEGDPCWRIGLHESPPGLPASETDVAEVRFQQGRLWFAWAEQADADWSGFLRNCVLELVVDGETHAMSLTRAVRVDPLLVDLKQGRANSLIRTPWPPDAAALRFEITGVEGRFLSEAFQPPDAAQPKAPIAFSVLRKDRHDTQRDAAALEIRFLSGRAGLTVHLSLLAPSVDYFREMSLFNEDHPTQPRALRQSLLDRQRLATGSLRSAGSRRKALYWNEQLDDLDRRLWYEDFFYHTHGRARIDFRLFLQVGPHEVELATTRGE